MTYTEIRDLLLQRTGLPGADRDTIEKHLERFQYRPSGVIVRLDGRVGNHYRNPRLYEAQRLYGIVKSTLYELIEAAEELEDRQAAERIAEWFLEPLGQISHDLFLLDERDRMYEPVLEDAAKGRAQRERASTIAKQRSRHYYQTVVSLFKKISPRHPDKTQTWVWEKIAEKIAFHPDDERIPRPERPLSPSTIRRYIQKDAGLRHPHRE